MADDPYAKYVKEAPPSIDNTSDPYAKYTKNDPSHDPEIHTTGLGAFSASALESGATVPPALYAGGLAATLMPGPPLVKGFAGLVGGVVGGAVGYEGIKTVEKAVDSVFGTNIVKTREAQQQQHPNYDTAGSVAGFAAGPGNTVGLQSAGKMVAGSALMGGIGAAQRGINGQDILDPKAAAIDLLSGAVIKPSALGEKIMAAGAKAGTRTPKEKPLDPILEELKKTQEGLGKPVVETAIPKVAETAFRKKDGTIVRSGPKHDEVIKAAGVDEPGFLTENSEFLTRQEALNRARETGQIPEDHPLEKPEEGLHSGDLRSAGDKAFQERQIQLPDGEQEAVPFKVTNPIKPTLEEFKTVVGGARTVGEVIDNIAKAGIGGKGQRTLLALLSKSEAVRNHEFGFVEHFGDLEKKFPTATGLHHPVGHLGNGGIYLKPKGQSLTTFLHEAVHAATSQLVHEGTHESLPKLNELFELSKQAAGEVEGSPLKHYGHTNLREFLSEAFTNQNFQKHLQSIKADGSPAPERGKFYSLWDRFKSFVKDGLKVTDKETRTTLDNVLDHGSKLIDESLKPTKELEPSAHEETPESESVILDNETNAGREKFIDSMVKKYGPEYKEAAGKLYDTKYANEGIVPTNHTQLGDLFYAIGKQGEADSAELFGRTIGRAGRFIMSSIGAKGKAEGLYQKATQDGVSPELRKKWGLAADGKTKLTESEQALYDKYIKGAEEELKALTKRQSDLGRTKELNFNEEETGKHVPRISVPKRKTALEFLKSIVDSDQGGFNVDIARDVGAVQERGFFVVEKENGTRVLIMPKGKDIIGYTDKGKQYKFGQNVTSDGKGGIREVRAGDKYGGWRIKEARVDEIEAVTPYRYLKDYQAVVYKRLQEARAFDRANNHLDNLMKSDYFKSVAKLATDKDVDPSWKTLAASDKVPQLAGYKFEPMVAATLEDYARVWQPNALTWMTSGIIKNMMLNPLPHMNNEAWHWYNARGLSGWTTPKGVSRFLRTMPDAMKSVITQDHFYTEIMKNGGSILGADVRNSNTYKEILQKGLKEAESDPSFKNTLAELGLSTKGLYDAVSKHMSIAMWTVRDAMYVQLVKEQQLKGKDLSGAIKEVERHMPSYRIDPTVLGSRELSKILQNPNVSVFSRYHFGMAKSLINTAKDMAGQGPEGKAGIGQGVDQAAAMVFALAVLYPMLDYGAQVLLGDKNAKLRRAGPYHLFEAVHDVSTGDKEPLSLLQPIFTFNPVLLAGLQLPFNREFYTGKQIYHPSDSSKLIAKDLGMYAAKQIPQVSTGLRVSDKNAGGAKQWAAQQLDIKLPTDKQLKDKEKWKSRNQRAAEKRKRKQEMEN